MIMPFWGEFLFDPCPLEVSMNLCSHGCAYCFACNRGYKGWKGLASVKRQFARFKKGERTEGNICAHLLNSGYPVVISNRSDPFAKSNRSDMPEFLGLLKRNNVPVFIQTKGGEGLESCASRMDRSLFYFTISYWRDSFRARIEPNAPTVEQRFKHIENVIKMGHDVVVGITPMVEHWLPVEDFRALTTHLKALGVKGVFMQMLHISKTTHRLSDAKKEALYDALPETGPNMASESQFEYYQKCVAILQEIGLCGYGTGQWKPTAFKDIFRGVYPKTFPSTQDFIQWVWENKESGDYVSFDEYFSIMGPRLPKGLWKLDGVIHSTSRAIGREGVPQYMTFEDLLKIIWSDNRALQCPARLRLFAFDGVDREERKFDNETGLPLLLVNKDGFKRGQKFTERRKRK